RPPTNQDRAGHQDQYRVNRRIRVPEVRVILDDGTQLGVMPTYEALRTAEERGLDLVEVSPKAGPPVCRIMDYGKFKFEQSKKTRQAKKNASVIEIKEIKFRPKTDDHDFEFKVRHIRKFLQEGNKVRLVIAFRGREIVHPETGKAMLDNVIRACRAFATVEQFPMRWGGRMVMGVSPRIARAPGAPVPGQPVARPVAAPAGGGPVPAPAPAVVVARPASPPTTPVVT